MHYLINYFYLHKVMLCLKILFYFTAYFLRCIRKSVKDSAFHVEIEIDHFSC